MVTNNKMTITISVAINAPVDRVWKKWITPADIIKWNNASPDWHTPKAENDLKPGGKFLFRMEAKDGSFGFDLEGVYDEVETNKLITYTLADGRRVVVTFAGQGNTTNVIESFEPETENPFEMQRQGWQNILDNFKRHVESN